MAECSPPAFRIADVNGCHVLHFVRFCNGSYFGGITHDDYGGLFYGSHVLLQVGGMLDLLGKLAEHAQPDMAYFLAGLNYIYMPITRHMDAAQLAKALDCDVAAVHDHFARVITLAPEAQEAPSGA